MSAIRRAGHVTTRWGNPITMWRRNFLPPVHRGYDDRLHRAQWVLVGPDEIVHNPWWNFRWLMDAWRCERCHDMRTRVLARLDR